MTPEFYSAIKGSIMADHSLCASDRKYLLKALNQVAFRPGSEELYRPPRIFSRREVARMLSVSERCLDMWSRAGYLPKVASPVSKKGIGILESDLLKFLETARQKYRERAADSVQIHS